MTMYMRWVLCVMICIGAGCNAKMGYAQSDEQVELIKKMLQELEAKQAKKAPKDDDAFGPSTESAERVSSQRSVTLGRTTRPMEPPKPIKETRVYDLADLFTIAPASTAHGFVGWDSSELLHGSLGGGAGGNRFQPSTGAVGGMGGMGGGMGGMMSITGTSGGSKREITATSPTPQALIRALEETIDAKWEGHGGEESIHWIGSSLIVSAYPETHTMVQRLLDLLQPRWNARSTFEVQLHWLWLKYSEENRLAKMMVAIPQSPVRSIGLDELSTFIEAIPADNRPASVHARLQCHNGQMVGWSSGSQSRTVADWEREKGKLIPIPTVLHRGVACEIQPMLAHASDHATLLYEGRFVVPQKRAAVETAVGNAANAANNAANTVDTTQPRPDADAVVGQSFSTSIRVPVGRATLLNSGSLAESDQPEYMLVTVASVELVSPRSKAKP